MISNKIKEYADTHEYRWTGSKDRFNYTAEGLTEASKYLEDIGEYSDAIEMGFSNDGYSIVYLANSIYRTMLWDKMERMWNDEEIKVSKYFND